MNIQKSSISGNNRQSLRLNEKLLIVNWTQGLNFIEVWIKVWKIYFQEKASLNVVCYRSVNSCRTRCINHSHPYVCLGSRVPWIVSMNYRCCVKLHGVTSTDEKRRWKVLWSMHSMQFMVGNLVVNRKLLWIGAHWYWWLCVLGFELRCEIRSDHNDVMPWKGFRINGPLCGYLFTGDCYYAHKGPLTEALIFLLLLVWTSAPVGDVLRRIDDHVMSR